MSERDPLRKEERALLREVRSNDIANNQAEYEAWVVEQLHRALATIDHFEAEYNEEKARLDCCRSILDEVHKLAWPWIKGRQQHISFADFDELLQRVDAARKAEVPK